MTTGTDIDIPGIMERRSRVYSPDRTDREFWEDLWRSRDISQLPSGTIVVEQVELSESSTEGSAPQGKEAHPFSKPYVVWSTESGDLRCTIEYTSSTTILRHIMRSNRVEIEVVIPETLGKIAATEWHCFIGHTGVGKPILSVQRVSPKFKPDLRVWRGRFSPAYYWAPRGVVATNIEPLKRRAIYRDLVWTKPFQGDERQGESGKDSTARHDRPRELNEKLKALFKAGRDQAFEDGVESEFSRGLDFLVKQYGNDALVELIPILRNKEMGAEAASEALRWLGRMDHLPSYEGRRWVLEHSLQHPAARVRDGAALGLAFLDDPHAIPHIKQAIQAEPIEELRKDMEQVLAQLESTLLCHSS